MVYFIHFQQNIKYQSLYAYTSENNQYDIDYTDETLERMSYIWKCHPEHPWTELEFLPFLSSMLFQPSL